MRLTNSADSAVLVALLHATLNAEDFESIADLCEALKTRAARLRIPYDADRLSQAIAAVHHTRPLVHRRPDR